jgi:hypothetical protein
MAGQMRHYLSYNTFFDKAVGFTVGHGTAVVVVWPRATPPLVEYLAIPSLETLNAAALLDEAERIGSALMRIVAPLTVPIQFKHGRFVNPIIDNAVVTDRFLRVAWIEMFFTKIVFESPETRAEFYTNTNIREFRKNVAGFVASLNRFAPVY